MLFKMGVNHLTKQKFLETGYYFSLEKQKRETLEKPHTHKDWQLLKSPLDWFWGRCKELANPLHCATYSELHC